MQFLFISNVNYNTHALIFSHMNTLYILSQHVCVIYKMLWLVMKLTTVLVTAADFGSNQCVKRCLHRYCHF